MKKILSALFIMAAMTFFVSCSSDDNLPDPSVRLSEAANKYQKVLVDAPNGWIMAMYGDLEFGGVNVLLKFGTDGKVVVANEKFDAKYGVEKTETTHYKLEYSNGIILSFDEYSELFHYFSDPINSDGYRSATRNGFGGDLEFRIISATAEKVVMLGKKHETQIVMTPMPADVTWADYLTQVDNVTKEVQKGSYIMSLGSKELVLRANKRNRAFTYYTTDEETGSRITNIVPYIITPKGITFYEPFSILDEKVNGFIYTRGSEVLKQDNGGAVVLEKYVPSLNQQLVDGVWYITKEGLGKYATPYWNQFKAGLAKPEYNSVIYYAVFGTWRNKFGLSVGPINKDKPSGVYLAECYFDYVLSGDDMITCWFNGDFDEIGNGEEFYPNKNARMQYAVLPFGGTSENSKRTFKIETDNVKDPTYLRLIDQNASTNVITLQADEVLYPFGDGPQQ